MKKVNRILSGALSVALIAALSACNAPATTVDGTTAAGGGADATDTTTSQEIATTTVATVTINTSTFALNEQEAIAAAAEKLPDVELENTEIKWLAHYDPFHANDAGQPKSIGLELFEQKYNGTIKYYETTWAFRWEDLSTFVLGGEGIDFFAGDDEAALPMGVVNGMFQPVDQYIDINDPIWDASRSGMEKAKFGDKHYALVNSTNSRFVLAYSANTIEENGLEDPYEQWKAGEWNWDTMKASLLDFCDVENEMYGLDGWWFERGLFCTTGVPMVDMVDGQLVCNINSPEVESVMNYGYDLYQNGLIMDKSLSNYTENPAYMGEGKQLFYVVGYYSFTQSPEVWPTKIAPEDLRIVPVPGPAGQDTEYTTTRLDGYFITKGASNPMGVVALTYCDIIGIEDEGIQSVAKRQRVTDYQLTDIVMDANDEINQIARANPVIEFAAGVSNDVMQLTTDGGETVGIRASFHGTEWATTREATADAVIMMVDEVNTALQGVLNAD